MHLVRLKSFQFLLCNRLWLLFPAPPSVLLLVSLIVLLVLHVRILLLLPSFLLIRRVPHAPL
jgi:hypothetical protein